MSRDEASTIEIWQIVGAGAAPQPEPPARLPEHAWRTVLGEVDLDRLPGGLRDVQQEINGLVPAGVRLKRHGQTKGRVRSADAIS